MPSLAPQPKFRFFTAGGLTTPVRPLVGGKVYFYAAGTTTPKDTYTDSTGTTPNTNPVILNARGEADIWLGDGAYKMVVTDAAGVQQGGTVDGIEGTDALKAYVDALREDLNDAAGGDFTLPLGAYTYIKGDGVADNSSAIMAANAAGKPVYVIGQLNISSPQTLMVPIVNGPVQIFTTTSQLTIDNDQAIRPEWFGNSWGRVVAALPSAGAVIELSDNTVYPPTNGVFVNVSNYTLRGKRRPVENSGFTGLQGGSIIQGPFAFRGDNICLEDFGVDSGSAVCASLYGGTAKDAFLSGLPVPVRNRNLQARRLTAICKDSASSVHGFALEGYTDSEIADLRSTYGVHGVALKMTSSNVRGLHTRAHGSNGVVIKTDTVNTTSERLNVSQVYCGSIGTYDGGGLRVTNSSDAAAGLTGVNIFSVVADRTTFGCELDSDNTDDAIDSVVIDGLFMFGCQTMGFNNDGMLRRCKVSNAVAFNTGLYGFKTTKGTGPGSGDNVPEIDFHNCVAANCVDGFNIAGRTLLSHCTAMDNTGIGVNLVAGSRVRTLAVRATGNAVDFGPSGLRRYSSASNTADAAVTFTNAWVNFGAGTEGPVVYNLGDDGYVQISGTMRSGTLGSSAFTLPVGFRPAFKKSFPCSSSAAGVKNTTYVEVNPDGTVVPQTGGGNEFVNLAPVRFLADQT